MRQIQFFMLWSTDSSRKSQVYTHIHTSTHQHYCFTKFSILHVFTQSEQQFLSSHARAWFKYMVRDSKNVHIEKWTDAKSLAFRLGEVWLRVAWQSMERLFTIDSQLVSFDWWMTRMNMIHCFWSPVHIHRELSFLFRIWGIIFQCSVWLRVVLDGVVEGSWL